MNFLVVIPARGGSKGVPGKNIKLLSEKPLIQYTIEAAREVFSDEIICVSTDDEKIRNIVEGLGLKVPFLRPSELATDNAGSYEVLLHAIKQYEQNGYFPEILVLLQATSPFRNGKHIKEAIRLFDDTCEMVVSVKESKANPYYTLMEEDTNKYLRKSKESDFIRRQDCPKVYELNGAIYIMDIDALKKNKPNKFTLVRKYVMDEILSHDIDTNLDWVIAEKIIESNYNSKE
jgi:CMP-N,N'-diacetyllegionaminic acid synthase